MKVQRFALFTLLVLLPAARAGEAEDLLDKAIRAHGGESALAKAAKSVRSMTGSMIFNGVDTRFTQDLTCDLPQRYRLEMEIGPEKRKVLIVVTPDKGWQSTGGGTLEMTPEHHKESLEEGHIVYAATLVGLRRDPAAKFQAMPDEKVQGKPAAVVKASVKGRDDLTLFFDKESGLLVRMSRKTTIAGVSAERAYAFQDHKAFGGAKLPTRLLEYINTARYLEGTVKDYKFLSRPEDKLFAKP